MYFMGIDIGTSSAKTAIFDKAGNMVSLSSKDYNPDAKKPGYAEQNPEIWWDAVVTTIQKNLANLKISPKEICAIGLSGQMHGLVPLDQEGEVVRKAILHCDVRAKDIAEELMDLFNGTRLTDIVMNPIFPGFQLVSLCWIKKYEPDIFRNIKKIICPKDYIRYRLTGKIGSEHTDASGTLLYDMMHENWSKEIFETLRLHMELVPEEIHDSYDVAGAVCPEVVELTGLSPETIVVYGGADQAMHSLGNGVFQPGTMTATIGTSGQVLNINHKPVPNPHMNTHTFRHVNPHTWYGLGAVLHAGSTLNWFRRNFAENSSYDELSEMASHVKPGCEGLVFFPCMGGERTPYLDSETRGMFVGMSMSHSKEHFARAIMEGVSFAMKNSIEIMNQMYGESGQLICAGGGVKNPVWAQMQADIYGREIEVSNISEQACLGAAIVASVGCGAFQDLESACEAMIQKEHLIIRPNLENTKKYETLYREIYSQLYLQNKELFHKMN